MTKYNTKSALGAGEAEEGDPHEVLGGEELIAKELARRRAEIEAIRALRDSGAIKPVTLEEILSWRDEGRRF